MRSGVRVRQLVVMAPLVVAALAGAMAAMAGRGADEAFLLRQGRPATVTRSAVARLIVRTAPDPRSPHRPTAVGAVCEPGSPRDLRNPWRCIARYRSGSIARFLVTVHSDGSYFAHYLGGTATATGCCLSVPRGG